ncbi:MAG TPA: hypothetical protein VGO25_04605 [Rhodanobacteraceae bacterium]|jgi:hypothetical protein|nr:hypothetical protein [Rhodanobacteraceae bacterium]
MNNPTPVPTPTPRNPRGSLLLGVACAWGMLIGGYIVISLLASLLTSGDSAAIIVLMLLPWIGIVALIVWFAMRGQPRTAGGVAIGLASIFGVGLLLIAACFGLMGTNFR